MNGPAIQARSSSSACGSPPWSSSPTTKGTTIEVSGTVEEKLDGNKVVLALVARSGGTKVLTRARAVVVLP